MSCAGNRHNFKTSIKADSNKRTNFKRYQNINLGFFFDVLQTVHLSRILVINQLNAKVLVL
jgi:hypothetical protein